MKKLRNLEKMKPINPFSAMKIVKTMLFITIFISFLPMTSAFLWDNIGIYYPENRTMAIINAFGFGGAIANVTLMSPDNVYVMPGEEKKVAWFYIENYEENNGEDVFGIIESFDLQRGNSQVYKNFKFKKRNLEEIEVPVFIETCVPIGYYGNGSEIIECTVSQSGTRTEYIEEWQAFNLNHPLEVGSFVIGLFTEVEPDEHIDWIPTIYGVEIEEWAEWTGSFNANLVSYWRLDETAGNVAEDAVDGLFNGTLNNMEDADWLPGIINNSLNFSGNAGDDEYMEFINDFHSHDGSFTMSFWVNFSSLSGTQRLFNKNNTNDAGITIHYGDVLGNKTRVNVGGNSTVRAIESTHGMTKNKWYHIVVTFDTDTDTVGFYINGTLQTTSVADNTLESSGTPKFGRATGAAEKWFQGKIDEIGFWSRTLSASEVSDLYNGGEGLTYVPTGIIISLNSPTDAITTVEPLLTFNATLDPFGINLINATLFIYDSTGAIFFNQTNSITGNLSKDTIFSDVSIELGTYEWNILGCGLNATITLCDIAGSNFTFTRNAFAIQQESFLAHTEETKNETFLLNITTISSILSVNANIHYNGTIQSSINACNASGFCQISSIFDVPLVDGTLPSQNKTFFWEIIVFDGTTHVSSNTTNRGQNVSRIYLEQCDATYTTSALNFTAYDEGDSSRIDPFYFAGDFDFWLGFGDIRRENSFSNTTTSEFNLCIHPTDENYTIDSQVEYNDEINGTTYDTRNYFFQQDIISNQSQDIFLFLLNVDDSTSFILKVQDTNLLPVTDALIIIQRFDLGTGNFTTVSIAKTDDNGQTVGFFKTETVDYRFIIKKGGVILLQTSPQKIIPETAPFTLTFTVGVDIEAPWQKFEDLEDLTKTLIFNTTTGNVTFTYIDTSGEFSLGRLILQKSNLSGTDETICDVNSTFSSSLLVCGTGNATGTYTASALITRSSDIFLVQQIIFSIGTFASVVGLLGVFLAWFIILISAFAFKFNEIAGIVLMNLTVIFVNILGLVDFGFLFIFGMIGVSIIIMVLLKK